jgi:hypothetical protein
MVVVYSPQHMKKSNNYPAKACPNLKPNLSIWHKVPHRWKWKIWLQRPKRYDHGISGSNVQIFNSHMSKINEHLQNKDIPLKDPKICCKISCFSRIWRFITVSTKLAIRLSYFNQFIILQLISLWPYTFHSSDLFSLLLAPFPFYMGLWTQCLQPLLFRHSLSL